uniref:SSD domain-containing protein n=1 Tax=Parascaris equorum TaxID=6256 RepID=A0A914S2Q9_PAREQ
MYFCYYSSAAICFIFAYSLTIFVACLSIQGRWEEANRNCIAYIPTIPIGEIENSTFMQRCLNMGSRSGCELRRKKALSSGLLSTIVYDSYAPFITSPTVQIGALISFICYAAIAYAGACNVKVGFEPVNMATSIPGRGYYNVLNLINVIQKDSPSRRFLEIKNTRFPNDVDLERTSCSVGRNTTDFWYFAYQRFVDRLGFGDSWATLNEDETVGLTESYRNEEEAFLPSEYDELKRDRMELKHDACALPRIFRPFAQGAHGATFDTFSGEEEVESKTAINSELYTLQRHRRLLMAESTSTAEKYRDEFNITTYTPLWALADQLEIIWPQTMQDLYISIGTSLYTAVSCSVLYFINVLLTRRCYVSAVMVPVSLFFIPQPLCALIIVLNIASVAFGVIGFMTWWDVNLDATSMITIAMSVGFSVDFAAHIIWENEGSVKIRAHAHPIYLSNRTFHALLYLPLMLMNLHSLFFKISSTIKAHTAVSNPGVQRQLWKAWHEVASLIISMTVKNVEQRAWAQNGKVVS